VQVTVTDRTPDATKGARPEAAVALFRIAQEALNNVLKHAQAKAVRIDVSATDEELVLDVHDDGRGFDPRAARRGRWGMTTMRERAEAAGGQLHIDAIPGQGTRIHARVPLS
jgi:protein-histidine pros-kinase